MLIQDIEEMRRQEGIEDPELRAQIGKLKRGDFVKLTFLAGPQASAGETLRVRITSLKNGQFRGKLASRPASPGLAMLEVGASIVFAAAHIHSLSSNRAASVPARRLVAAARSAHR